MDEVLHEIGMISDLQKTEVQDLNRVEAEVNTLKAWRAEMPSAIEISKRKVAKDDPIHAKIDNLRKMTDDQEVAINKLEDALTHKIETVDH